MNQPQDTRRYPRMAVEMRAMRRSGSGFVLERVVNISFDGVGLAARDLLRPGQQLDLVLSSDDGESEVSLQAEVMQVRSMSEGGPYLLGLQVVSIDPRLVPTYQALLVHQLELSDSHRFKRRLELHTGGMWRHGRPGAVPTAVIVENLSLTGALVSGPDLPARGEAGELIMVCPEDGVMAGLSARARWASEDGSQSYAGLQFDLNAEQLGFLNRVIRGYLFSPRRVPASDRPVSRGVRLGAFSLGPLIARGGMCDVYAGRWEEGPRRGEPVALKRLRPEAAAHRGVVDHFITEADLGMMLDHPSIARVHTALLLDGDHWIAMERVEGRPLAELLVSHASRGARPRVEAVTSIGVELLAALEHCHGFSSTSGRLLEVVHGDLTPSNVMLCGDGAVKLIDFGVASTSVPELNEVPGFAAKLPYMPPELYLGRAPTPLADVFQLGVLLYEGLTGVRPFKGHDPEELCRAIRRGPVPPSRLNPEVKPKLQNLVTRALAFDPQRRPQGARAFSDELFATGDCPGPREGAAARAQLYAFALEKIETEKEP